MARPLGAMGLWGNEAGARAATLGGAFVGRADDVTAVFYNPAALVFFPGLRLKAQVGAWDYSLTARSMREEGATTIRQRSVRTSVFLSYVFKDRIGAGLGVFPAHAWDLRWPDYWPYSSTVTRNTFYAFAYRGVVSIKVLDSLALGLNVDALEARENWNWVIRTPELDVFPYYGRTTSEVELKGAGLTFGAGLFFKPRRNLSFGLRYQHGVSLKLEGRHFRKGVGVQRASLDVRLPAELAGGFRFRLFDRLSLQADVKWTDWSRTSPWRLLLGAQVSGMWDFVLPQGEKVVSAAWRDTVSLLCGAEFALSPVLFLRAGCGRLPSAVSRENLHPFVPGFDENVLSAGLGYEGPFFSIGTGERLGDMSVDVFVRFSNPSPADSKLSGFPLSYSSRHLVLGVGLGFIYGQGSGAEP